MNAAKLPAIKDLDGFVFADTLKRPGFSGGGLV
jgi:hypothetical protein